MATPSVRTQLLIGHVEKVVASGGSLKMTKYDRTKQLLRYLDENKRNIAIAAGSITAAAIIGGPIGLAVAAGGKALIFAGTSAVQGVRKWWKRRTYTTEKESGNVVQKRDSNGDLAYNVNFKSLINDMRYLLQHQGLTDITNAFANTHEDYTRLTTKFLTAPVEPKPGEMYSYSASALQLRKPLADCDEAVSFWENISRVGYRFGEAKGAFDMLDEWVLWQASAVSVYDAHWVPRSRELWNLISKNGRASGDEILQFLNTVVNSQGVRKHAGRRLGRVVDYIPWIYGMLPDYAKDPNTSMGKRLQWALAKHMKPDEFKNAQREIRLKLMAASGKAAEKSAEPSKGWEVATDIGKDMAKDFAKDRLKDAAKETLKESGLTLLNEMFAGDPETLKKLGEMAQGFGTGIVKINFSSPEFISGTIEMVVSACVEAANKAWNEWQLANGKTLGLSGMRMQTRSERVTLLKQMSKEAMEEYVSVVEEMAEAHELVEKASSREQAAEGLLRFQATQSQYYGNRIGEFFQLVVLDLNFFQVSAEAFIADGQKHIDNFLTKTHSDDCCKSSAYCYGSLKKATSIHMAKFSGKLQIPLAWHDVPVQAIEGMNNLEYVFSALKLMNA
jgi:hypothetical protein